MKNDFVYSVCISVLWGWMTFHLLQPIFFIVVLGGSTLWHLQKFLRCSKYIILEFTPPPLSFIPPSPILEEFQQVSFLHLHTCVHIFCVHIFTLLPLFPATSFFLLIPPPHLSRQAIFIFLFMNWSYLLPVFDQAFGVCSSQF
jgi:hypothetical protein